MGATCTKMDERDKEDEQQQQQQQQQQPKPPPPPFEAKPTLVDDLPPPPTKPTTIVVKEDFPPSPPQTPPLIPKRKRKDLINNTRSLFRVGSRRTPNSPARASNYNHVHKAVAINFQEAAVGRARQTQVPLGVVGLRNLGNTCFLNSSLQCLSATIPLTDYFLGYNYRSEINKQNFLGTGGKLVVAYAELMKIMWLGKNTSIKPTSFKGQLEKFAPQFVGYHQHDAQELLSFLLDGIHEDLNRIKKKPYIEDPDFDGTNDEKDAIEAWKNYLQRDKSLIVDIFQGQTRTCLQCLHCGHKNIRFEPFMYLSLPMLSDQQAQQQRLTLEDCLELYVAQEKLTGDNQWYCAKCKEHRDATKKTDLWILPPILIVHLKRFKFNEYGHMGSKNESSIDYPIDKWNLSRFVKSKGSERPLYDLYAVSNHVGGLGSGHYTAYAKNRFDDKWYEYNDSSCRRITGNRTLKSHSSSAYLLFYNRSVENNNNNNKGDATTTTAQGEKGVNGFDSNRPPLIRRQSVSRPDLWPHTQVQNSQFREFARHSVVKINLPEPPLNDNSDNNDNDNNGERKLSRVEEQESVELELEAEDDEISI